MVVEQEMAEVYPPTSEDLSEILPDIDCRDCGFPSCMEFGKPCKKTGSLKKWTGPFW